jgi:hypothetical protein
MHLHMTGRMSRALVSLLRLLLDVMSHALFPRLAIVVELVRGISKRKMDNMLYCREGRDEENSYHPEIYCIFSEK